MLDDIASQIEKESKGRPGQPINYFLVRGQGIDSITACGATMSGIKGREGMLYD